MEAEGTNNFVPPQAWEKYANENKTKQEHTKLQRKYLWVRATTKGK